MISFEPTDDQKMVRDSVAQFAERTLRPRIREFERARSLPDDVLAAAHAMGLPLAAFPEAVGGSGLGGGELACVRLPRFAPSPMGVAVFKTL